MDSLTRGEVEIMLRDHGQELEVRILDNASRSHDETIAAALEVTVGQSQEVNLLRTEVNQMRDRLDSMVTKEGQKEMLMQYMNKGEIADEYGNRMVKLEAISANITTELVDLQKSVEATEQKMNDLKAMIGKDRDEVRVDWSARLTQLKETQTEANSYINELRRRVPELEISVVSVESKLTETNRQVADLVQGLAEVRDVAGPPGPGEGEPTAAEGTQEEDRDRKKDPSRFSIGSPQITGEKGLMISSRAMPQECQAPGMLEVGRQEEMLPIRVREETRSSPKISMIERTLIKG